MKTVTGLVMLAIGFVWWIGLSWSHPDMTERRLLIEFWPQFLAAFALMIGGAGLLPSGRAAGR